MQFQKKKQRLILNGIKRHQTAPKMQSNFGLQQPITQSSYKNGTILRIQNSSQSRVGKQNLIRCLSISSFLDNCRTPQKLKGQNKNSLSSYTPMNKRKIQNINQQTAMDLNRKLRRDHKQGDTLIIKHKQSISLAQTANNNIRRTIVQVHRQSRLKMYNVFSIKSVGTTSKNLSFNQVIQLDISIQKPYIQIDLNKEKNELVLVLNEHRYLKSSISKQQAKIAALNMQIQKLNKSIISKEDELKRISASIRRQEEYLFIIEQKFKGIVTFADREDANILKLQIEQQKQNHQELMDIAFIISNQACRNSQPHNIHDIIFAQRLKFKNCLQEYHEHLESVNEVDEQAEIRLVNAYQSTINKLSNYIHRKSGQLQKFAQLIKMYSANGVRKHQYLTFANNKMAVTSAHIEYLLDQSYPYLKPQFSGTFTELKKLFQQMLSIYSETQIFY